MITPIVTLVIASIANVNAKLLPQYINTIIAMLTSDQIAI